MEDHAAGLGKLAYLTGESTQPDKIDLGFSKRSIEDAIVKGWLLKTMEPHLLGLFIGLPATKNIWDSASHMFYYGSNAAKLALDKESILLLINQISLSDDWDDSEKSIKALITLENCDSRWIIDYGASNHMTYDKSFF